MHKNGFIKTFLVLGLLVFGSSAIVGCTTEKSSQNLKEMTDSDVKEALFHFRFNYGFIYPDSDLSYKYLWDGYDLENKFGPRIPEEDRLYTYLTEYLERDAPYYLIYLKKGWIEENEQWLIDFEENRSEDIYNYHFSAYDDFSIIDGKYYYCYQRLEENKNEDENIRYYTAEKLGDICYEIDDYRLVFCAESKQAVIKENVSLQKTIGQTISLYKRVELIFEDENETPKEYLFENYEKVNQNTVKELFDYVGERIEAYPSIYEDTIYGSYPVLGMEGSMLQETVRSDVVKEGDQKYFLLPRYVVTDTDKLDLLSDETDLFFEEDVFREYKEAFSDALVKESDFQAQSSYIYHSYIYALYDYDKVVEIIQKR